MSTESSRACAISNSTYGPRTWTWRRLRGVKSSKDGTERVRSFANGCFSPCGERRKESLSALSSLVLPLSQKQMRVSMVNTSQVNIKRETKILLWSFRYDITCSPCFTKTSGRKMSVPGEHRRNDNKIYLRKSLEIQNPFICRISELHGRRWRRMNTSRKIDKLQL